MDLVQIVKSHKEEIYKPQPTLVDFQDFSQELMGLPESGFTDEDVRDLLGYLIRKDYSDLAVYGILERFTRNKAVRYAGRDYRSRVWQLLDRDCGQRGIEEEIKPFLSSILLIYNLDRIMIADLDMHSYNKEHRKPIDINRAQEIITGYIEHLAELCRYMEGISAHVSSETTEPISVTDYHC
jgi:hypothetical protein